MKRLAGVSVSILVIAVLSLGLAQTEVIGAFKYRQIIDPITDADDSYIATFTDPDVSDFAMLVWQCEKSVLYITSPQFGKDLTG